MTNSHHTMQFEQEGFPERLTIVEHSAAQTLVEVDLGPGGGTPMHVHRDYAEWFEVLEGTLEIRLADRSVNLAVGNTFTAAAGVPHCFVNSSPDRVRFRVALRAGQRGFLEMQLVLFGLRADGRVKEDGTPRDPRHMAVALGLSNTTAPNAGGAFMLRTLRALARVTGEERRLRERYVEPAEPELRKLALRAAAPSAQ